MLSTINDTRDVKTNTASGKAYRVEVVNESVPVEFAQAGQTINIFNEANSVAEAATANIISYTVPTLKEFRLKRVEFSGANKAIYSIEINSAVQAKRRTYYTKLNTEAIFDDLILAAGDILDIIVQNGSTGAADFNANMQGNLRDA